MAAMAVPVVSRRAEIMASLTKQKPVSSTAMTVPEKARLKREIFTITDFPASEVLNADGFDGNGISPAFRLPPWARFNNMVLRSAITGVIRFFCLTCK